jgi:uncharacterized membrane protein
MTVRSCPDWPDLMEVDPDLQFKHYTANEAKLPAEAQMQLTGLNFDEAEVCVDLDKYVYNAEHTHPQIAAALTGTHWVELRDPSRPH